MKLSLAMIVKNEEKNLQKCLGSVKGLVDEIVIIDTGSTDKTIEIAKANGAIVERFTWADDFSAARNKSLSLCTGDWILTLDADEMLDPQEHGTIRQALLKPDAFAYNLSLRNYLHSGASYGINGSATPNDESFEPAMQYSHYLSDLRLRLFRNVESPHFSGRIHETVEIWAEKHGYSLLSLNAVIHHFGKHDAQRELDKQPYYYELAKKDLADNPNDAYAHYNVLQEAAVLEDWPAVIDAAKAVLRLKGVAPVQVYISCAKALVATGRPDEALDFLAPADNPAQPDPCILTAKADALQVLGRLQEAVDACVLAIDTDPNYTAPYIALSKILDSNGDMENARKVLEAGLDQNTKDLRLWESLVGLSAKYKDDRVAHDAWHAILSVPTGGQGIWHQIVAHALLSSGDTEMALEVLDRGINAMPDNTEIIEMKQKYFGASA
ncbi:MAG: glycosyltransferase [Holophagales bacterium]|jgi:tetratricopeptide (TPR) repeat protein|nr:glycosyltransferase [Holophagales bacterium]